jgi:peroxiredoxin
MKSDQIVQAAQLAFIALSAFVVYAFVSTAQDGEARAACTPLCALRPAYAGNNRAVPEFELPDLNGNRVKMSSLRGKPVVINFWTKTCKPCLEEMPSLVDLHTLLAAEGATLITISTDESADDARATLQATLGREPPFPVLIDPEGAVVSGKFGTRLYPETWIIDPDGVIRARVDGARDWTSPMVLDVVRMVRRPVGCGISFDRGKPRGDRRSICADTGVVGDE